MGGQAENGPQMRIHPMNGCWQNIANERAAPNVAEREKGGSKDSARRAEKKDTS